MQHNGLGTILLGQLIEAADQAGVAVLSAEVLPQNQHMLHVFRDSGIPVTTRTLPAWSWSSYRPRGRRGAEPSNAASRLEQALPEQACRQSES